MVVLSIPLLQHLLLVVLLGNLQLSGLFNSQLLVHLAVSEQQLQLGVDYGYLGVDHTQLQMLHQHDVPFLPLLHLLNLKIFHVFTACLVVNLLD